jgi:YgiT-type zinc finger domain-containing protein
VIEAALWTDTDLVVIEGIPVRRCDRCGELFFEEEVARRGQEALSRSGGKSERQIQVSVYSMRVVRAERTGCDRRIRDRARAGHEVEQVFATAEVDREEDKVFACQYCGSETAEHLTRSAFWMDGRWVAVENIPARVCQRCKEQFYDDETVERIAAMREGGGVPGLTRREVRVPVLSCAHVTGMEARSCAMTARERRAVKP